MAYGLKYSQYLEQGQQRLLLKVYQKDYSGTAYGMAHLTGASLQVIGGQSDVLSPVLKTSFSWSLADCWDEGTTQTDGTTCVNAAGEKCGKWEEFYTNDATKYKVELSVLPDGGSAYVIWTGYVTPDSWAENLIYRGSITVTARDMLGALKDKEFDLTGRVSVLDIVQGALSACLSPMALSYTAGHFLVNSDGQSILSHTIAASTFAGDSWQTTLEEVLESLGLVLRYNGVNGLVLTSLRYIKADTLRGTHGAEFTGRSGLRQLDPAIKEIVEVFDVDLVELACPDPAASQYAATGSNLTQKVVAHLAGGGTQTSTNYIPGYTLTQSGGEGWSGTLAVPALGAIVDGAADRGIYFPTDLEDTVSATQELPRMRGGFVFKIEQDGGLVELGTRTGIGTIIRPCTSGHAISEIRIRVEVVESNTTKYLTADGSWTTTSTTFPVEIGREVIVPEYNGVGAKVVIEKVVTENTMPAYFAILAALKLSVSPSAEGASIISEYKTTTIYNEDNNVTIKRDPKVGSANYGGCVDFVQNVLAYGSAVAPDEWNWPGASSYLPLAVMIQAQILCYHAAAASLFTGTMHDTTGGAASALPGYGISYYARDCVPVSGTYDFVSGFVGQVALREVYSWESVWGQSFDPQYTQTSGSGSGSTSATGASGASVNPGSGSSGGGGAAGSSFFQLNDTLSGLVELRSQYTHLGPRGGLFFDGATLSGTPTPDLYVDTVNNERVLRTPLPLITGGDQIVNSGTPGQGGGGGMPYMRDIQDVLLSATVGNGDLLQWNGSAWVNVSANTVGVTTLASASAPGLMSSADYSKLAGIASGATNVTESTVSGWGFTKNAGTVTSVKVGSTSYSPSSGVVSLPAYPTTLPASDVYAWAKAATKPSYTLDEVTDGATRKLSDYVLKAGDTMTGDLIISKTGGGNLIIRGTEANHDGGTLYFYGRYYSGNPRNGAKIAAVYPGSGVLYDIQDLVFSVSRNRTDATPTWEEAMRIASTKAVSMTDSLSVGTTLSVSGLATLSGGATIPVNKKLTIGDAEIEWIPNSGNGYLRINKPLLTVGDQIVNSGTPGGGGGGGGASSLFELADVLTDANKTNVKQYDGTTNAANNNLFAFNGSKWYALKLGTNLAISSGTLSATNTTYSNGAGLALSNGVFSITSAYQTNIANGASAYSTLTASQTKNKVLASPSNASGAPSFRALVAADLPSIENLTNFSTRVYDATTSRTANYVLAAPNGSNGAATFRKLVAADIPSLSWNKITSDKPTTLSGYGITDAITAATAASTYVLKAGDTMTGDLAIKKSGGGVLSLYGTAHNGDAGEIVFQSHGTQVWNGFKISAIAGGTAYDLEDLVFYTSSNTTSPYAPDWQEAVRIKSDKAVSMSGSLSISRGGVYNIYTNNTASDGTASGIRFQLNGTTKGGLFVSSDENLYYSVGTASTGNRVLTTANYDSYALPLAGGTMTGSIKLTNGTYINAESGYAMCGIGSGGETFYCGPGAEITNAFYIRSGNINLTHVKAGTNYTIWDASNSNLSTVDWAANNLTVAGTSTFSDTMYVENRKYMYWKDSGGTSRNVFGLNNTDSLLIGYGLTSVTGSVVAIYGETVRLNTGMTELVQANGATLRLAGTGVNTGGSKILFRSSNTSDQNGFKIEAEAAASSSNRGRLALNFFTSNNTTSPYAPDWKRAMRISYNGNIMFGNTASGSEFYPTVYSYGPLQVGSSATNKNLTVYGSITSSGDQVISSDATKKKNWRDLKYGVADIAKATAGVFDWKDGKGESAGTKAQDWMHLVPQLVHGEEGHMTLAYGQIAMLNSILLARRSEDHEERIKALELENAELRKEIERLRS